MPVMAPLAMASDTPRTACTLPNDFWMPESSIAGAAITASTKAIFRHSRYFRQRAWCVAFSPTPNRLGCAGHGASTPATKGRLGMNDGVRNHGYNGIITMVIIYASAIRRPRHLQALLLM